MYPYGWTAVPPEHLMEVQLSAYYVQKACSPHPGGYVPAQHQRERKIKRRPCATTTTSNTAAPNKDSELAKPFKLPLLFETSSALHLSFAFNSAIFLACTSAGGLPARYRLVTVQEQALVRSTRKLAHLARNCPTGEMRPM